MVINKNALIDGLHSDGYFLHMLNIACGCNAVSQPNQERVSSFYLAHHHLFEKTWRCVAKIVNLLLIQ